MLFSQDLTGGTLVPVEGPLSLLYALEVCAGISLFDYPSFMDCLTGPK